QWGNRASSNEVSRGRAHRDRNAGLGSRGRKLLTGKTRCEVVVSCVTLGKQTEQSTAPYNSLLWTAESLSISVQQWRDDSYDFFLLNPFRQRSCHVHEE